MGVVNHRVPGQGREPPPADLSSEEAVIWFRIVDAMPDGWFGPEVQPVLKCLVSHIATTEWLTARIAGHRKRNTAASIEQLRSDTMILERESKAVAELSTKLRLTPKSKYGQEQASFKQAQQAQGIKNRPWVT